MWPRRKSWNLCKVKVADSLLSFKDWCAAASNVYLIQHELYNTLSVEILCISKKSDIVQFFSGVLVHWSIFHIYVCECVAMWLSYLPQFIEVYLDVNQCVEVYLPTIDSSVYSQSMEVYFVYLPWMLSHRSECHRSSST